MNTKKSEQRGQRMPQWLAVCFGLIGLTEDPPKPYLDERSRPKMEAAKPAKPSTDWRNIPLLNDYNLLKRIGKGGFSEIWLSEHTESKETVAIKVVQLTFADLEPDEAATLLAEAKFLRTLDCPYLVKCKASAFTEDWLVLVLEYCSGGEMLDHIHKVHKYTEAEAAKLFAQIVSAISYLHNLNLIHRDIKPENVMFATPVEQCEAAGRPLRVKVIDLGMAMVYNPDKEVIGCVGTPGFVAPEVWHEKPQTFAMDIYSLGVMLFIMLTGRKPHSGADIKRMVYCDKSINDAPGLKDERFLALSSAARELLLAMLADDPRVRPSCLEVLRHPFITAVDSNAEAHREMSAEVRRRIRDLHRVRRLHGLRYAMHGMRPVGSSQQAFLEVLEQRRNKLKSEGPYQRESTAGTDGSEGPFPRSSLWGGCEDAPSSLDDTTSTKGQNPNSGSAKGRKGFGRVSGDGAATGGKAKSSDINKLGLLSALPEMNYCPTMPPQRFYGPHPPELSPVPSCDPAVLEEAMLPRNWSAHPVMYEALQHTDQLMAAAAATPANEGEGGSLGPVPAQRQPGAAAPPADGAAAAAAAPAVKAAA